MHFKFDNLFRILDCTIWIQEMVFKLCTKSKASLWKVKKVYNQLKFASQLDKFA